MLDGFVYAVGGWEGSSRLDSVERYDPESNIWTPMSSLKMAVTSPAVVAHEGSIICLHLGSSKLHLRTKRSNPSLSQMLKNKE